MLLDHNDALRGELDRFRGREIVTTGDGFLALFDSAARAVRCAAAMTDAVRPLGVEIRAGLHTGEVNMAGGNARGARGPCRRRAWRPSPVRERSSCRGRRATCSMGPALRLEDRGENELKGLEGVRRIFALVRELSGAQAGQRPGLSTISQMIRSRPRTPMPASMPRSPLVEVGRPAPHRIIGAAPSVPASRPRSEA